MTKNFVVKCKDLVYLMRKIGHDILKRKKPIRKFIFDTDRKLIYLNNPKVACSSIKTSMLGEQEDIYGYALLFSVHQLSPEMEQYYKFTFVRNPFKRLVSCFESKCIQCPERRKILWGCYGGILQTDDFKSFIQGVFLIPNDMAESHFAGQYQLVYDKKGKCLVDFVGKVENIKDEYEPIRERFDLLPLSHENRAASLTGKNWMDYYTPFTAWLVYRKYKKDFTTFGYEDEYKKLKEYLKNKKT